jgi:hypothetical protein
MTEIESLKIIKVAICNSYGGFSLSDKALELYIERKGYHNNHIKEWVCNCSKCLIGYRGNRIARDDPILIQVIEELGNEANNGYCKLKIVSAVKDFYNIWSYDGMETMHSCNDLSGYIKKLDIENITDEELGKKVKNYLHLSERASKLWSDLDAAESAVDVPTKTADASLPETDDASLPIKQNDD